MNEFIAKFIKQFETPLSLVVFFFIVLSLYNLPYSITEWFLKNTEMSLRPVLHLLMNMSIALSVLKMYEFVYKQVRKFRINTYPDSKKQAEVFENLSDLEIEILMHFYSKDSVQILDESKYKGNLDLLEIKGLINKCSNITSEIMFKESCRDFALYRIDEKMHAFINFHT